MKKIVLLLVMLVGANLFSQTFVLDKKQFLQLTIPLNIYPLELNLPIDELKISIGTGLSSRMKVSLENLSAINKDSSFVLSMFQEFLFMNRKLIEAHAPRGEFRTTKFGERYRHYELTIPYFIGGLRSNPVDFSCQFEKGVADANLNCSALIENNSFQGFKNPFAYAALTGPVSLKFSAKMTIKSP